MLVIFIHFTQGVAPMKKNFMKTQGFVNQLILPFILIIVVCLIALIPMSYYVIEPGFAAIHLRLGTVIKTETVAGAYTKIPFVDTVVMLDMRIKKDTTETNALSKDLQAVSIGMVVNYRIQDAAKIYQNIGTDFEEIIIDPYAQEDVKAVVALYNAENLIQKRHEAKELVIDTLRTRLATKDIQLVDFNFTHLDFSRDFMHAVEAKQIAEQSAKQAENLTKKVLEEVIQSKARSEAEAYALQVKKLAVTKELIELQKVEIQLKAIEKWDGHLPRVSGGTMPFLNLNDMA